VAVLQDSATVQQRKADVAGIQLQTAVGIAGGMAVKNKLQTTVSSKNQHYKKLVLMIQNFIK
jgi:hypothetical protein